MPKLGSIYSGDRFCIQLYVYNYDPICKKKNIYHWYVISKHSQTDGSDGSDALINIMGAKCMIRQ